MSVTRLCAASQGSILVDFLKRRIRSFAAIMLVSASSFGTVSAQINFTNVTDSSLNGVLRSETWGVSVGDIDGDNWPDIFVSNHRNRPSLYQYDGNGKWWNNILQRDENASWLGQPYIDTHAAAWSDFDGDGDEDIVVGTNAATYHFLMISEGQSFTNEALTRIGEDTSSSYSTWFDFDQDGLTDLFQGRDSGNLSVYFRQQSSLGSFDSSIELPHCDGDWAFLSDVTDDDIADYICNKEGAFPKAGYSYSNGTFQDITASLPNVANVVDSIAVDLNNDLRADLLTLRGAISASGAAQHNDRLIEISSDTGNNEEVIFGFTGGGSLTLRSWSPPVFKETKVVSDSTVIGGFNVNYDASNDSWTVSRTSVGWQYAYLQIQSSDPMTNLQNTKISSRDRPIAPELYQRESGAWVRRTVDAGLNIPIDCKSVAAADFDNDMDQDLYMVCGRGAENIANRLFSNDGNGVFSEVANAGGAIGDLGAPFADAAGSGESVVTGDFNNDGFIDLFVVNGNNSQPVRGRFGRHELMLNDAGNGNHWIELNLVGTSSDADATGARVVAITGGVSQLRESGANYHRWSQNHNRIHFGLGVNSSVDLTVRWPRGLVEQFFDVQADALYTITEGTGIAVTNINPPAPFPQPVSGDECGSPRFTDDMDSGLFIYRDCVNDGWRVRATSAMELNHAYAATLVTTNSITIDRQYSIESNDTLSSSTTQIDFVLNTANGDMDGFDFTLPPGSNCLSLNSSLTDGARVMLGANHLPITLPINLETLGSCSQSTNNAPILNSPGPQTSDEGESISLQITATDSDADPLSFSASGLPVGLNIDNNGLINGSTTMSGTYTVEVTVIDNNGGSDSVAFVWTVIATGSTPSLSVADVSVSESSDTAEFVVTLAPANTTQTVTVTAAGVRRTATPGQDYYGFVRNLTFAPNETTQTVSVTILDDSEVDPDEILGVRLFNATNAEISDGQAEMLIVDNDNIGNSAPVLDNPGDQQSVANISQTLTLIATDADGDSLNYTASGLPIGLSIDSSNGIIAGTPNSVGSYNIVVTVDDGNGGNDTSSFNWTIVDAPVTPSLSVSDITINEEAGNGQFTVTLSPVNSNLTVTVNAAATRISATPGSDYYGFFRALTFAPNEGSKTVTVTVLDDTAIDPDEQFGVRLYAAENAIIANGTAVATIIDNDGSSGNVEPELQIPANQINTPGDQVNLNLIATDADGDTLSYSASGLPVGLSIDSNTGLITGTTSNASTSTVTISVSDGNGGMDSGSFIWTVESVTGPVSLSVDDVSVDESAGTMIFTVTKTPANVAAVVTVRAVSAQSGTASQGSDYFGFAADLSFAGNEAIKTVTVPIVDDSLVEADETLGIRLLNAVNAQLVDAEGVGTIIDDDISQNSPPQLLNPGNQTQLLNAGVNLQMSASDSDGDTLSFSASGLPLGVQINSASGLISGNAAAVGSFSTAVTVTDGNGGSATENFVFVVRYVDGFEVSSGWVTNPFGSDNATTGFWQTGDPVQTSNGAIVMQLDNAAGGSRAMITDPDAFAGLGCCDIDNGVTSTRSAPITLGTGSISMSFKYYLAYLTNATSDDFFRVRIETSNGTQTVFEELAVAGVNKPGAWKPISVNLDAYAGQSIRVILEAADNGGASLVEAGVDDLTIE